MAMCNIPSTITDHSYRYKMPKIVVKVEGGGNGIKTCVVNMSDIALALKCRPQYPTKWFGYELGAQTDYTDVAGQGERAIVNGAHDANTFQGLLDKFIEKYILCENCHLPELSMKVRKDTLKAKCKACGWSGELDSTHKIGAYMLKKEKKEKKVKKEKEKESSKDKEKESTDDDRASLEAAEGRSGSTTVAAEREVILCAQGEVKYWNLDKGEGALRSRDVPGDVQAMAEDIEHPSNRRKLYRKEVVQFDVHHAGGRAMARRIRVVEDIPLPAPLPPDAPGGADCLPEDLPPMFAAILRQLVKHRRHLGGAPNFAPRRPHVEKKIKGQEFKASYTDYEFVYLTVLGFAQLHVHCEEIVAKNTGTSFEQNPGTQLLDRVAGMTMHADRREREGTNALLRTAAVSLVQAFELARSGGKHMMREFFGRPPRGAFDRTADACLEGRLSRILAYLEQRQDTGDGDCPHWEDVSMKKLAPGAKPEEIVGEHLRVFLGECVWQWSREQRISYQQARERHQLPQNEADFGRLYNAETFKASLVARNVVDPGGQVWEHKDPGKYGKWNPFDEAGNRAMDEAKRGLGRTALRIEGVLYEMDFERHKARDAKHGTERDIRQVNRSSPPPGMISPEDLHRCIEFFALEYR